jgi:hypothetical protein
LVNNASFAYILALELTGTEVLASAVACIAALLVILHYIPRIFPAAVRHRSRTRKPRSRLQAITLGIIVGVPLGFITAWCLTASTHLFVSLGEDAGIALSPDQPYWLFLSDGVLGTIYAALAAVLVNGVNGIKPRHRAEDNAFSLALETTFVSATLASELPPIKSWWMDQPSGILLFELLLIYAVVIIWLSHIGRRAGPRSATSA